MGLFKEFKEFAMRGNVVDMAVGIVIGAAFGKIVSSLVSDVVMPPIGLLTGGLDFSEHRLVLKDAVPASEGVAATPVLAIGYGTFVSTVIDFVVVAFAIFMLIKAMNVARRKQAAAPAPPPAPPRPTPEVELLTEIRDALRRRA